ncbi:MAG: hypothetical protein ACXVXW_02735 [Mycobacteriaceae bacterium]
MQSCQFRDQAAEFTAADVTRAGSVATTSPTIARQREFDAEHHLGYRLLFDADGVTWPPPTAFTEGFRGCRRDGAPS